MSEEASLSVDSEKTRDQEVQVGCAILTSDGEEYTLPSSADQDAMDCEILSGCSSMSISSHNSNTDNEIKQENKTKLKLKKSSTASIKPKRMLKAPDEDSSQPPDAPQNLMQASGAIYNSDQLEYLRIVMTFFFVNMKVFANDLQNRTLDLAEVVLTTIIWPLLLEAPPVQEDISWHLTVREKRFDEFEKKFHSKLRTVVYQRYKTLVNSREDAYADMQSKLKITSKNFFDRFFGKEICKGLKNEWIDWLLKSGTLFETIFTVQMFGKVLDELKAQTDKDIETNIMGNLLHSFNPNNLSLEDLKEIGQSLKRNRAVKMPYTYLEDILAAEYFLDKVNKRANRKELKKKLSHQKFAALREIKEFLVQQKKLRNLDTPRFVPKNIRDKDNFVEVVGVNNK